jgi:hypothetical protein
MDASAPGLRASRGGPVRATRVAGFETGARPASEHPVGLFAARTRLGRYSFNENTPLEDTEYGLSSAITEDRRPNRLNRLACELVASMLNSVRTE